MNSNLFHLNFAELEQFHFLIKERYQRFCVSGWNIDMTDLGTGLLIDDGGKAALCQEFMH